MTNLLPAAVGADGRVNLFVGNVSYMKRSIILADNSFRIGSDGKI